MPLLRGRLWCRDPIQRGSDHRRARGPGSPGQLRTLVHQGPIAAPDGRTSGYGANPFAHAAMAARSWRGHAGHGLGRGHGHGQPAPGRHRAKPRPRRLGLLHFGPVAHRRLLRLQQTGQGPSGHQQHRQQLAPVHEQRRGGLQDDAGGRCPTGLLRGHRARAMPVHRGQQRGLGAPDFVSPHRRRQTRQPNAQDGGGRSAPHRHRRHGRSAPGHPAGHRRDAVPRPAAHHAGPGLGATGLHRHPHQRL